MNEKTRLLTNKIIIIAMFTALCCAATFVQIRMPAGDFVHLGNFVMIISALLLGGIAGGIVGSFGMGLYDLIFYSSKPTTIARTFILKFIIGFLVGYIFRLIIKRDINAKKILYVLLGLFIATSITSIVLFALSDKEAFSLSNGFSGKYNDIFGSGKSLSISLYVPIFSVIFTIGTALAIIYGHKLTKRSMAALVAVLIAVFVNVVGEFILRFVLEGLFLSSFKTSIIVATSKIPGSLITGFITVFLSVLVYEPVYRAVKNNESFRDDTEEITFDSSEEVAHE
jgi:uncharacterized membrane protein